MDLRKSSIDLLRQRDGVSGSVTSITREADNVFFLLTNFYSRPCGVFGAEEPVSFVSKKLRTPINVNQTANSVLVVR